MSLIIQSLVKQNEVQIKGISSTCTNKNQKLSSTKLGYQLHIRVRDGGFKLTKIDLL